MPARKTPLRKATRQDSALPVTRQDAWRNVVTGLGDALRDKLEGATYRGVPIDYATADDLWEYNDMAARIIETRPDECVRQGFDLLIQEGGDSSLAEAMQARCDELDVLGTLKDAMCHARAHGGAGILLGADDGQRDLERPLDIKRVRTFDWMSLVSMQDLWPETWYADPGRPKFGEPETYRIRHQGTGALSAVKDQLVHESRIIRFDGVRTSRVKARTRRGWGGSVLQRCHRVLSRFDQTWDGAAILLSDFAQTIIKMKGLAQSSPTTTTTPSSAALSRLTTRAASRGPSSSTRRRSSSGRRRTSPASRRCCSSSPFASPQPRACPSLSSWARRPPASMPPATATSAGSTTA